MFKKYFAIFFSIFFSHILISYGQADTVNAIREINISDSRLRIISETGRIKTIDSSMAGRANAASLSDLIGTSSAAFLKDNGGGRLTTISIRGTTAAQTALSWNGMMINTPTLGLSDLSLFPAFFIDDVAVQYGGNGPLNGSSAIGGAIHLFSSPVFSAGWQGKLFLSNASFNDFQQGAGISYSGKKYLMRTRFFHHAAENNYTFKDNYILNFPEREQVHASTKQNGFLQEHFLLLNKDLFSIQGMYLDADREIPPQMGAPAYQSEQDEKDKQLRLVSEWKHFEGKLQTMVRFGLLDDRIDFNDKMLQLVEKSHGQSLQPEAAVVYNTGMHKLQGGILWNYSNANINSVTGKNLQGYPERRYLNRSAVYFSYTGKIKNALTTTVSIRKEIEKEKNYPLLPSLGIRLHLFREFYIYSNAAAVYRLPTLNDLYWTPGGNPDLNPEKGIQSDLRMHQHFTINKFSTDIDAGVYYMKINNWIQWVPDNNNYTPLNIETVTSKGVECSGNITFQCDQWKTVSGGELEYTLATNQNGFGLANVAGKQLIYTPEINWVLTQSAGFQHSTLQFQFHYTGYRYTTADNSEWLLPYGIANCYFTQEVNHRFGNVLITAGVNNIFDKKYEVVALRPMPGRWFRLSIMLNIESKKSTQLIRK